MAIVSRRTDLCGPSSSVVGGGRFGGARRWTVAVSMGVAVLAGLAVAAEPAKAAKKPGSGGKGAATRPAAGAATKPSNATKPAASGPTVLPSGRAMPAPVPPDAGVLTDAMIDAAIRKGATFLLTQFDPKTQKLKAPAKDGDEAYAGGEQALAVYALMQSGLALPDDKRLDLKGPDLSAKVERMIKFNLSSGNPQSYAYGIRATALALYVSTLPDLSGQKQVTDLAAKRAAAKDRLSADALWCITATNDGGYHYVKGKGTPTSFKDLVAYYDQLKKDGSLPKPGDFDNSCSQYGLLGAWSAAEAEIEIPTLYWYLVANHWQNTQMGNGQWYYGGKDERKGTLSMTAAGLASMLVSHEYVEPAVTTGSVGREPYNAPIKKGLAWFERDNNAIGPGGGYAHYGVERVGLASGFKFFGQDDWYKVLAARIIGAQNKTNGGWGTTVETAYNLLFLARGRHPIVMNKLRFDGTTKAPGFWANRPRDAANLAKGIGKQLERPVNWQVVNVDTPWQEWLDGPVLSIASHQAFKFSPEELDKIRNYVEAGGVLYTQADGSAPTFDKFAAQLAKDLFKKELVPVPADHPLYTTESVFKIQPPIPLKMVTNGSRVLMVHSAQDLAKTWQARDDKGRGKPLYQFGMNLFIYSAGKGPYRNRLESLYVAPPKQAPAATYPVALLSYAGQWNPEPGAWRRYATWFQRQTGYKLDAKETKLADLKPIGPAEKSDPATRPGVATKVGPSAKPESSAKLDLSAVRFAHLTGVADQKWTPAEVKAVKAFVDSGGVLFVDVTGGGAKFDGAAQTLIRAAFPAGKSEQLTADHPILTASAKGMEDCTRRAVRQTVLDKLGREGSKFPALLTSGKGAVIYTQLDVTSGLLGTNTLGVVGYESNYAMKLLKNVVIWTLDGAPAPAAPVAATTKPAEEGPASKLDVEK